MLRPPPRRSCASQLARGRFDEAVESARQARWQSIRYQERVRRVVLDTRRDVARVDWRQEVPALLKGALDHIADRIASEQEIVRAATERLRNLRPDDDNAPRVARVAELIRDCHLRHMDLHDQVMGVRNVFLDAQARQAFTPMPGQPLPELTRDVLAPLLSLERRRAQGILDVAAPGLLGPLPPKTVSLAELTTWLLQPRRAPARGEVPIAPPELAHLEDELARYPDALRHRAEELLAAAEAPVTLSALLAAARTADLPGGALELVVLLALQHYDPDAIGRLAIAVDGVPGTRLDDPAFWGDELEIAPLGDDQAMDDAAAAG